MRNVSARSVEIGLVAWVRVFPRNRVLSEGPSMGQYAACGRSAGVREMVEMVEGVSAVVEPELDRRCAGS